ncbi:thioesterase family protein [Pseudomonas sp. NPDC088444]|uniref:thioesterase family protein n=1 Tax=Pseudomonas sp. NPDC088444 TaxID=3364456 RepID=UPI00384C205D
MGADGAIHAVNDVPDVLWSGPILSEWTDYNGHLRDAFYLLIFSLAGDALLDHLGLDSEGRARTGHSMFTLECHLNYLKEMKHGDDAEVRWQLIGADAKRLHLHFSLHPRGRELVAATAEQMWLNVDMSGPKSAPFAPSVHANVSAVLACHRTRERPPDLGRSIALPV